MRKLCLLAAVLLAVAWCGPARAQEDPAQEVLRVADRLVEYGDFADAEPLFVKLAARALEKKDLETALALTGRLANIHFMRSLVVCDQAQGTQQYQRILDRLEGMKSLNGPTRWMLQMDCLIGLGEIALGSGRYREARGFFQRVLPLAARFDNLEGDMGAFVARTWLFSLDSQRRGRMNAVGLNRSFQDCLRFPTRNQPAGLRAGSATRFSLAYEYWIESPWEVILELALTAPAEPNKEQASLREIVDLASLSGTFFTFLDALALRSESPELRLGAARARLKLAGHLGHDAAKPEDAEVLFGQVEAELTKMRQELAALVGGPARSLVLDDLEAKLAYERSLTAARGHKNDAQALSLMKHSIELFTQAGLSRGSLEARLQYLKLLRECHPQGWELTFDQAAAETVALARQSEDPSKLCGVLFVTARGLAQRGLRDKALPLAQESVRLLESMVMEAGLEEEGQRRIRSTAKPMYDLVTSLLVESARPQDAFTALARGQQLEGVIGDPSQIPAKNEEMRRSLELAADKKMQTRALQKDLQGLRAVNADPKEIQATSRLLAQSKSEFFQTVEKLRSQYPKYGGMLAVQPVEFAKLQKKIPSDTLVVQIYPTDDQTYLFLISNTSFKIKTVSATARNLEALVQDFRARTQRYARGLTENNAPWQAGPDAAGLKTTLSSLYQIFVAPLEEDLASKSVVAFIPTGSLLYMPMQALGHDVGGKFRFLIEDKQVVNLARAVDLDHLGNHPVNPNGKVLALGNPDGTLAMAGEEVRSLKTAFPSADVFTEGQATADRLGQGYDFVHLATHGHLDRKDPTQSYLTVAGSGEKACLRIAQIFDLPLGTTRLVTLSACETALGEANPGAAITSLAEAFWVAGTPTVVASLWSVEDNSTKELMVEFYANLRKQERLSLALQKAQLKLLADPRYGHPFFWAPFILIGDWQ